MLKNYFKIAFRNLWRHKIFSLINIMGLAVGMTAGFLIFLYVSFELSYDSFHSKADRIYRIVADIKTPTEVINADRPAWAVPPNVKAEFPEVESFVRVADDGLLIRKGDEAFQEDNAAWVDSSFFHVFDFKLLKGNPQTVLKEPYTIVLSEVAAKKYFGKEDPIGKTLLITGDLHPAKVTGVMEDMPENSQIKRDMLLSMTTRTLGLDSSADTRWGSYWPHAYLLLKPGTNVNALQAKLPAFLVKRNGENMKQSQMVPTLFFEKLKDVYLY